MKLIKKFALEWIRNDQDQRLFNLKIIFRIFWSFQMFLKLNYHRDYEVFNGKKVIIHSGQ